MTEFHSQESKTTSERQEMITGLDFAKSVFHVAVLNCASEVVSTRKLRRKEVLDYFAEQELTLVAMEACDTSHYWGRELTNLGHELRLLPPKAVKVQTGACHPSQPYKCQDRACCKRFSVKTKTMMERSNLGCQI